MEEKSHFAEKNHDPRALYFSLHHAPHSLLFWIFPHFTVLIALHRNRRCISLVVTHRFKSIVFSIKNRMAASVICYEWWQVVLMLFVILVLVPLPFLIGVWRWFVRRGVESDNELSRPACAALAVLEKAYKPNFKWWETMRLCRRFVIITLFSFVTDPFLRAGSICLVCALVLFLHVQCSPFRSKFVLISETCSLSILFLLSLCAMRQGALSSAGANGLEGEIQKATLEGINIVVLVCTILPIIYFCILLVRAIKECWSGASGVAILAIFQ